MARVKLTAERVRTFHCPPEKGQVFLWDSDVPGLGVRATAGAKVFVFQGRLDGKTIRMKIGDIRTWFIEATNGQGNGARQEARRLQGLIDKGIDPRIEKVERIAEQAQKREKVQQLEIKVSDAWGQYIEARQDKWSARHLADHNDLAKTGGEKLKRGDGEIKAGPLAQFMSMKLSDLTPERIETWAKAEAEERPARARLAFSLLRAFLRWCDSKKEYRGIVSPDACDTRIKKEHIPKMTPKDDCLQKEQLQAWFSAVRGLSNEIISAYLQILLLTGARREELAGLKWNDVDFQWNSIRIGDKIEESRTIPMTPYVRSLLESLPKRESIDNQFENFVFWSKTSENGRVSEPRHAHNRAQVAAGIEGLTIHGLRRSFGTLSEWVEVPVGIVAQIMGHRPSAIAEKHYRRRPLDLLRLWHLKIESWILVQAGVEQQANGAENQHQANDADNG